MSSNSIKSDFYKFESLFFKNDDFSHDSFYNTLDSKSTEDLFYSFLEDNPLKNDGLDRLFLRDLGILTNFLKTQNAIFTDYAHFKSELDVLSAYLLLFLIKTFETKVTSKNTRESFFSRPLSESARDFIFDRNNFVNVFTDFLQKLFVFVEIKLIRPFPLSDSALRKFTFRFIALCEKKNLVRERDVYSQNSRYKVLHFPLFFISYNPHVVLYTRPFEHYIRSETEFYSYNRQFYSLTDLTKRAKYSNSSFHIPGDQVSRLFERSLYIDRGFLQTAYDWLLKERGLSSDTDLHKKVETLSSKIEKFSNEGDLYSLRLCHSKLSKLLTLIRIKAVLSERFDDLKIYLPFMFCFRGRIYELGDLSFTFYREFRFCLYTGFYETEVEHPHPISTKINLTLEKQFVLFDRFTWFSQLSDTRKRAIVWVFTSLGALKKVSLGKEVHISRFIELGFDMWEKRCFQDFEDVYEKIEFNYLLNLVDELISVENNLKKRIFWKDAPASCFQHLLSILGESGPDSYKVCNLDSDDTWYDPYSYLIQDFFEKNCDTVTKNLYSKSGLMLSESRYFEIFSRKRLKKVLMTESYGAGKQKLSFFFKLDLGLESMPELEKNAILAIWDEFFDYISDENFLFAQSSKAIVDHFDVNNIKVVENPDKTRVDYSCFTVEVTQSELYIEKKRHTFRSRNITIKEDKQQFRTSIRANFVQSRDSVVARRYAILTKMWSIHDCFSMDLLNITYMVALINALMNDEFYDLCISLGSKKAVYSIFIIL